MKLKQNGNESALDVSETAEIFRRCFVAVVLMFYFNFAISLTHLILTV